MAEVINVIKTFLVTAAIILLLQVQVGGVKTEDRVENFLQKSGVAVYIQSVAAGGVIAMRNLVHSLKDSAASTVDGFQQGSKEQSKAQR